MKRESGILFPISALPSKHGIGSLGETGKFIDFLKASHQKYWQVLPVNPCDCVYSPYAAASAFAGNFLLIDLHDLIKQKLVLQEEFDEFNDCFGCDYEYAKTVTNTLMKKAYKRFIRENPPKAYEEFVENTHWLRDYAFFSALKNHFNGASWNYWPDDIRLRKPAALTSYADLLADEIDYFRFEQYIFDTQWQAFREKLKSNEIGLIGDIPFYIAYDSADCWAHSDKFLLDEQRRPKCVAGVPPDAFSESGQLWGNPLYNWESMRADKYLWWRQRVQQCGRLYDVLRIDHFRAFDSYYVVDGKATNAKRGFWKRGDGKAVVGAMHQCAPNLRFVAEDLGIIPPSVIALRKKCGMPGMKILQFAFDGNSQNSFLPENFEEDCVAYLGTHDNDTIVGWWKSLDTYYKKNVLTYLHTEEDDEINWKLLEVLFLSKANLVIATMQDLVGQGSDYRINIPGEVGCWRYMANDSDFSNETAQRLKALTKRSHR